MEKYVYHTACRRVLGDMHTPVSVYMRVRDMYPKSGLARMLGLPRSRKQPFVHCRPSHSRCEHS